MLKERIRIFKVIKYKFKRKLKRRKNFPLLEPIHTIKMRVHALLIFGDVRYIFFIFFIKVFLFHLNINVTITLLLE